MAEKQPDTTTGTRDPRLAPTILDALDSGRLFKRIDEAAAARGIVGEPIGDQCRELAVQVIVEDLNQPIEEVRAILDPVFEQFMVMHQAQLRFSDREQEAFDLGREHQARLSHIAWEVSR